MGGVRGEEGDEETCRDMVGSEMKVLTNKSQINKDAMSDTVMCC